MNTFVGVGVDAAEQYEKGQKGKHDRETATAKQELEHCKTEEGFRFKDREYEDTERRRRYTEDRQRKKDGDQDAIDRDRRAREQRTESIRRHKEIAYLRLEDLFTSGSYPDQNRSSQTTSNSARSGR